MIKIEFHPSLPEGLPQKITKTYYLLTQYLLHLFLRTGTTWHYQIRRHDRIYGLSRQLRSSNNLLSQNSLSVNQFPKFRNPHFGPPKKKAVNQLGQIWYDSESLGRIWMKISELGGKARLSISKQRDEEKIRACRKLPQLQKKKRRPWG